MAEGTGALTADHPGIKLAIKTPAESESLSRGFYQQDEDILSVIVYPTGKFFSYLDSRQLTLDIGDDGGLLSIQIYIPRRNWIKRGDLVYPATEAAADVRFIDFRENLPKAIIESNRDQSLVHIVFSIADNTSYLRLTDNLALEITKENRLTSIWIRGLEDDRASRAQSAWLGKLKNNKR